MSVAAARSAGAVHSATAAARASAVDIAAGDAVTADNDDAVDEITIPVMLSSFTGIVIFPITIPVMLSGHLLPLPAL